MPNSCAIPLMLIGEGGVVISCKTTGYSMIHHASASIYSL